MNINEIGIIPEKHINGMTIGLFLKLAFCRAFELEFGVDEYQTMEYLDYDNEVKYTCLQDIVEDKAMKDRIDKHAVIIRDHLQTMIPNTEEL